MLRKWQGVEFTWVWHPLAGKMTEGLGKDLVVEEELVGCS